MKDWTVLIAHPDDELIFCWPVLKDAKKIVCASSDKNNPQRQWCRERRTCLEEVGRLIGSEVVCLDYDSEFYRLPHRTGELKRLAALLLAEIAGPVFTHNPWGEYGHMDHILLHQIACQSGREVWCSDTAIEVDWLPIRRKSTGFPLAYRDAELFAELRAAYDAKGCWTWSFDVPNECGVFQAC